VKVQSKANIVVVTTSKPLKRKLDSGEKNNGAGGDDDEDDDVCIIDVDSPEKKFGPMLLADHSEISITPIRKASADDKQQQHNGKEATVS
jgi:hypothetical protein